MYNLVSDFFLLNCQPHNLVFSVEDMAWAFIPNAILKRMLSASTVNRRSGFWFSCFNNFIEFNVLYLLYAIKLTHIKFVLRHLHSCAIITTIQFENISITKKFPCVHLWLIPILTPSPRQLPICFLALALPFLEISYKWNHTLLVFWTWLLSFVILFWRSVCCRYWCLFLFIIK